MKSSFHKKAILTEWKKDYIMKIIRFEYNFLFIEWKYVFTLYKYILLNRNLFWLNEKSEISATIYMPTFKIHCDLNWTRRV